jgi:hypothetical protein
VKPALGFPVVVWFVANTSKILMDYIKIGNVTTIGVLESTPDKPGGSFTRHEPGITIASQKRRRISQFSPAFSPD